MFTQKHFEAGLSSLTPIPGAAPLLHPICSTDLKDLGCSSSLLETLLCPFALLTSAKPLPGAMGKRQRDGLCCSLHSSEREASCGCESPTSKEVKLGYSSHWHQPPWPQGICRSVLSVRKYANLGSYLWGHPHFITQLAVSVKGNKNDSTPTGIGLLIQILFLRSDHSFSLVLLASGL